jgi:ABC-type bacteriocin/lantibiotic exporter with double-glycine peptidase domain
MLQTLALSIAFMTRREKVKWFSLVTLRILPSTLDLLGIFAIGWVATSTALFLTEGSAPDRSINLAGMVFPAVTAQTLPLVAIAILSVFLVKALTSILITRQMALFVAQVEARAAKVIAENVFGGDLGKARQRTAEETAFAIQFGSPAAFNVLLNSAATVFAEGSLFVLICLGFLIVNPTATIFAVAYFVVVAVVMQHFIGSRMAEAGAKSLEGIIQANEAVGDLTSVFRELSVLNLRSIYIDKIYMARIAAAQNFANQTYLTAMPRYIVESALLLGVAAFILAQALAGDIVSSAATIGVFLSGGFRLTAAMLPLQSALLSVKGQLPSAQVALEILFQGKNLLPSLQNARVFLGPDISARTSKAVRVSLDAVSFRHKDARSLAVDGITLTIEGGEQVAFIGPSGAGKSTIADLICGILQPSGGSVELTAASDLERLRAPIFVSYVPQKPGLVAGSVVDNVALGIAPNQVNEAEVWSAIERAHLGDVIRALPEGLKTDLGKNRDGLSGGQIQRLGLARALFSKPGLLVMDEATSALDAESEAEIARALDQMRGEVTVVLIAHRLNTVQHADKVFLIDKGKLVDTGSFRELLARNDSIERLVKLMKVD